MNAGHLKRAALWSRRVAAAALLVVGARFAWVTGHWAADSFATNTSADAPTPRRPRTPVVAPPGDEPGAAASHDSRSGRAQGAANVDQRGADKGASQRSVSGKPEVRTLFVDLGPPRSEVYVSGVRVGQTPYAGTWSCVPGDAITIHVVPPKGGVPLESRAACQDSMRAVAGRTLSADDVARLLADPSVPPSVKDALRH